MQKNIVIHGAVTLQSPLHSHAGFKGLRLADGQISSGKDGLTVMSTVTMPLTVRGRFWGQLPIFPASSVVGALRRLAAQRYLQVLTADEAKLSQQMYYALTQGQPAQAQMSTTVTREYFEAVSNDIFFGMFGGASIRNAAAFTQNDLIPITEQTIEAGMVPERFSDLAPSENSHQWQLVDYRVMRRIDDIKRGMDRKGASMLQEGDEDLRTEAAAAYQVIPPGTSLYWRCQLKPTTSPEQRGLFMLALMDLLAHGQFGAKAHIGWGNFTPQRWRLIDGAQRFDLMDLRQDEDGLPEIELSPACQHMISEASQALEAWEAPAARLHVEALIKGALKG